MSSTRGTRLFALLRGSRAAARPALEAQCTSARVPALQTLPTANFHVPSRSMVDFASADILGIEERHRNTNTMERIGAARNTSADGGQNKLRSSVSLLHGKGASVVSDRCFSDMLRPALDALTQNDAIFVDIDFPERHLLTSCKAEIYTFDAKDISAIQAMLQGTNAQTKMIVIENGSSTKSIRRLKKLCSIAKENQAKLILSDTHGSILIRHIIGSQPELLSILQQPDVICSNLDIISGTRKVSCVAGSEAFIESLNPPQFEGTVQADTITQIFERFRLLPRLAPQCKYSLSRSQGLKRSLEELGLKVKVQGFKVFVQTSEPKDHAVATQLWDSGFTVSNSIHRDETGIQLSVKATHNNEDIRGLILALCDSLSVPVSQSALSRFRQREQPLKIPLAKITKQPTTTPKHIHTGNLSEEDLIMLESVYSRDPRNADTSDTDGNTPKREYDSSTPWLLGDPMETGLI